MIPLHVDAHRAENAGVCVYFKKANRRWQNHQHKLVLLIVIKLKCKVIKTEIKHNGINNGNYRTLYWNV